MVKNSKGGDWAYDVLILFDLPPGTVRQLGLGRAGSVMLFSCGAACVDVQAAGARRAGHAAEPHRPGSPRRKARTASPLRRQRTAQILRGALQSHPQALPLPAHSFLQLSCPFLWLAGAPGCSHSGQIYVHASYEGRQEVRYIPAQSLWDACVAFLCRGCVKDL